MLSFFRQNFSDLLLSLLSALALMAITFFWLSMPYNIGDEAFLIKWGSLLKKKVFQLGEKSSPDDVLFVDISASKTTVPGLNEFGEPSPYFRKVVTDRILLSEFLNMVNDSESVPKLLVLDILLEDKTDKDAMLQTEIDRLGTKIIGVSHLKKDGTIIRPALRIPFALSTYKATNSLFLKYQLIFQDSLKTLPIVMHELINQVELQKRNGIYWVGNYPVLTNPIVDYKVLNADFKPAENLEETRFTIYPLGTLLELRESMDVAELRELFEDKIIILGDFQTDLHSTPFDLMTGPVLIYNAYLTVSAGENQIKIGWLFLLLIGYAILAYRAIKGFEMTKPAWLLGLFQSRVGRAILNSLDELFFLTLITLLSYFLFNIHINILLLLIIIKFAEFLFKKLIPDIDSKPVESINVNP